MKTFTSIAACAALALCSAPQILHAQTAAQPADQHAKMMLAAARPLESAINANFDKLFMLHAATGNMFEIESGKVALQKSRNPEVRMVAQTLIKEHSAAQRDLAKNFAQLKMPMPKMLDPIHAAAIKEMKRLSGAKFDQAFMAAAVVSHETTIVLFQHEVENGKVNAAVQHAKNKLPHILGHTAMIYDVAAKVKAPGIELRPTPVKQAAMQAATAMKSHMNMKR